MRQQKFKFHTCKLKTLHAKISYNNISHNAQKTCYKSQALFARAFTSDSVYRMIDLSDTDWKVSTQCTQIKNSVSYIVVFLLSNM